MIAKSKSYYKEALKYQGTPYRSGGTTHDGIDCSGLVNAATGQTNHRWHTSSGTHPPGSWELVTPTQTNNEAFLNECEEGDLFIWKGHAAFYAGGERLFHAQKPGKICGYTNDLKIYWLKVKGYPIVYRQI